MESPTLVVTGASGFVGGHLCAWASERDINVVRVGRRAGTETDVVRDVALTTDWSGVVSGADWVVHLAATVHVSGGIGLNDYRRTNVDGTLRLAEAAAGAGVKRFVFASTAGIAGTARSGVVTEDSPPRPEAPYAVSKLEAEQRLLQLAKSVGMDIVILRPPLVYGPGAPGNPARLRRYIESRMPLPIGCADNSRSSIAVANLVDALGTALTSRFDTDKALYVEDGTVWSSRDMAVAIGETIGRRPILVPVPPRVASGALRRAGKARLADQLFGSLVVDGSAFRSLTGWEPPLSPAQAAASGVV